MLSKEGLFTSKAVTLCNLRWQMADVCGSDHTLVTSHAPDSQSEWGHTVILP